MSCGLNQTPYTRNTRNPPTSLNDHSISQHNLDISPIWTPVSIVKKKKKKKYNSIQCRLSGKICVHVGTIQRIYLSSDDFYSDSTLVLGLIHVEFLFWLNFCRWFVLWFVYPISYWCRCPEIGTSSIDWVLLSRFYLKTETESSSQNVVLNKNRMMDNVQKHNIRTFFQTE
jgi:hypothetical protein